MSDHAYSQRTFNKNKDSDLDYLWQRKRLTPHQLLIHDVRLELLRPHAGPRLELRERVATEIVPHTAVLTSSERLIRAADAAKNPIEQQKLTDLEEEYGWMSSLRIKQIQEDVHDPESTAQVRWIHISSKFPDYLRGCLWALSGSRDARETAEAITNLNSCINERERYSKHGKYFEPFWSTLSPRGDQVAYPLLMSVPFLDWGVNGSTPPLRFQVDKREGFSSSRSASHLLRTVLQHFYRLEDTADREKSQVFGQHKPWKNDRDLDLKVRRWHGQYPTCLNVDELWILVIDREHIVTFSSNQSWKSRWPPMQLAPRIVQVAFRAARNEFFDLDGRHPYTSLTHSIVCIAGAVGMLHRTFWADVTLPLSERFAGYLGHLQYRIYRAPSTKLVIDLMQMQEELNIIVGILQKQLDLIDDYRRSLHRLTADEINASRRPSPITSLEPFTPLANNVQVELNDLKGLLDNTTNLVNRTVQLVNLRQEDHGNAVLVFTVITIVFLPLNFVCSFFGMNVSDIRNMNQTQSLFWIVAACVTAGVVSASILVAFNGGLIMERIVLWKEKRRHIRLKRTSSERNKLHDAGFHVHTTDQGKDLSW